MSVEYKNEDSQTRYGKTAEGLDYMITFWYEPGALEGAQPIRAAGSYQALDGGGSFDASLNNGEWVGTVDDERRTADTLLNLLPWVVSDVL